MKLNGHIPDSSLRPRDTDSVVLPLRGRQPPSIGRRTRQEKPDEDADHDGDGSQEDEDPPPRVKWVVRELTESEEYDQERNREDGVRERPKGEPERLFRLRVESRGDHGEAGCHRRFEHPKQEAQRPECRKVVDSSSAEHDSAPKDKCNSDYFTSVVSLHQQRGRI